MTANQGNETQTLTVTATGGTFTLSYGAETTSALAFDVTGANLKTALVALNAFDTADLTVTGNGPYTIAFGGQYIGTNVSTLVPGTGSLTGGTATIVTNTQGNQPVTEIVYVDITNANGTIANQEVLVGQTCPPGEARVSKREYYG